MKKIGSLALVLVMALSMAACSDAKKVESKGETGAASSSAAESQDAQTEASKDEGTGSVDVTLDTADNFVFTYEGVDILLGSEPTATLEKLGDAKNTLTVPSCAHDGTDYVYTYNNMSLTVYIATGSETGYISDVLITSDLVATPEGVEIGMAPDAARSKYGDPDQETDAMWVYKRGTSELLLTISSGKIVSIEYMIP
ncbi:MAG: hypothetical protein IKX04_01680 [Clostridiales bacterium]|nr:hypothetical protein [Clostridiales bacterium]MBR4818633.1 hypothetical protein [Clostridiales bacterium]MBR5039670.1 hypothetical protein [Clostridiales bacterium]MBR5057256.1 hypothetical protein [Clostridiales bacterium]